MNKFFKYSLGVLLISSVLTSGVACRRREENVREVDTTKTQMTISNYDAGIGRTWIEKLSEKFEQEFAGYSFEEGKTGIQIWFNHSRDDAGDALYDTIADSTSAIFCTEDINYITMASSKLYNVTDVVKKGAITGLDSENNLTYEENAITSKLSTEWSAFLNTGTDGSESYYALPYYCASNCIVYDIDLWNEQALYFSEGGCPSEIVAIALKTGADTAEAISSYNAMNKSNQDNYFFVNGQGKNIANPSDTNNYGLSAGPDGKYGTDDDGLPATYEEFYYLCSYMKSKNITPFIWTGKTMDYSTMIMNLAWQNHSGAEELRTYYTLQGTAKDLVKVDGQGKVVKDTLGNIVIDEPLDMLNDGRDNGYDVQRSAGKYYALQFVEKIAQSDWTAPACFSSVSNIGAQSTYLTSVNNAPRIGMLCEGTWWMQESQNTFSIMEKQNAKYSINNRNFGMLSMPNATIEKLVSKNLANEKTAMVIRDGSYIFLNGNLEEGSGVLNAARIFFSYLHSDESMNEFTSYTYMKRQLNYSIDSDVLSNMPAFAKAYIKRLEDSELVYPISDNSFVNMNLATFGFDNWQHKTYNATFGELTYPMSALHDSTLLQKGLNAQTYFEGIYNYYKNVQWKNLSK